MHLADFLYPATVRAQVAVDQKKALFPWLGDVAERALGLPAAEVTEALIERERLGSTGFGRGVALPHAKIAGLAGIRLIVARLTRPIDFAALDGLPVDLVFALLSPPDAGAEHLKALATVSRFLRDGASVERLRGANSDAALYAIVAEQPTRDAA